MLLAGKKVLITGGAGFLGSHLCERLLHEGAQVRIFDSFDSGKESTISVFKDKVEIIIGDIADEKAVTQVATGMQVIIHTAIPLAIRQQNFSLEQLKTSMNGFFNVLAASAAENALLVNISSIAVYGNGKYTPIDEKHPLEPEMLYGAVKLAEEYYCRTMVKTHGLKTIILRVADIYGPRNTRLSVPIRFLLNANNGCPNTVYGTGSQSRTYTYVSDFVEAVLLAITNEMAWGDTFNVAGDQCVSMLELAKVVKDVTESKSSIIVDHTKAADSRKLEIDISKAKRVLNFKPRVDLATGLKKTYEWILKNPHYYKLRFGK